MHLMQNFDEYFMLANTTAIITEYSASALVFRHETGKLHL